MAFVVINTVDGPKKVRVCDYCFRICRSNSDRFCGGECRKKYREYVDGIRVEIDCKEPKDGAK